MASLGFFDLQMATDLLCKLEREYARLEQDPDDVDHAYNFFATAENMPEWIKGGGRKGKAFKHAIQQQQLILTLCNELATGAKHFTPGKQNPAVVSAAREGYVAPGYVAPGYVAAPLTVRLNPQQATKLRQEAMNVLELASQVLTFWQRYLGEDMAR